ncbi:MAG: hypothetical protein JSW65_05285 [Candidatus Bipolaricaulota bacterium]|nr:MAG: hypothetical protein JSW65_05285 [Candidatus Bipolaricaulota bacterium]
MIDRRYRLLAAAALAVCSVVIVSGAQEGSATDPESLTFPTSAGSWAPGDETPEGRAPQNTGEVEIRGVGTFTYDPTSVETSRPDLFQPGFFSVFDLLLHLAEGERIELEYGFDDLADTHVIRSLNGLEGWWYDAHYEGGWFERTVVRMDHYPIKDGTQVVLFLEDPERLQAILDHHREEVERRVASEGAAIIPEVTLRSARESVTFENVLVTAHDLRADVFQPGTVTALDVLLSLGEQGLLDGISLEWRFGEGEIGVIDSYLVRRVAAPGFAPEASESCALTHQASSERIAEYLAPHTHTTSHIHLSADLEILVSPESLDWMWNCQ